MCRPCQTWIKKLNRSPEAWKQSRWPESVLWWNYFCESPSTLFDLGPRPAGLLDNVDRKPAWVSVGRRALEHRNGLSELASPQEVREHMCGLLRFVVLCPFGDCMTLTPSASTLVDFQTFSKFWRQLPVDWYAPKSSPGYTSRIHFAEERGRLSVMCCSTHVRCLRQDVLPLFLQPSPRPKNFLLSETSSPLGNLAVGGFKSMRSKANKVNYRWSTYTSKLGIRGAAISILFPPKPFTGIHSKFDEFVLDRRVDIAQFYGMPSEATGEDPEILTHTDFVVPPLFAGAQSPFSLRRFPYLVGRHGFAVPQPHRFLLVDLESQMLFAVLLIPDVCTFLIQQAPQDDVAVIKLVNVMKMCFGESKGSALVRDDWRQIPGERSEKRITQM